MVINFHQGIIKNQATFSRPTPARLDTILNSNRLLMIGDSLGHDILGGYAMGWDTLLLLSGVHASDFVNGDHGAILEKIIQQKGYSRPTYMMERLK